MHIVFTSIYYLPVLGGSVQVLERIARECQRRGHNVTVITKTPCEGEASGYAEWVQQFHPEKSGLFLVCRNPSFADVIRIIRSSDAVVMIEMSLARYVQSLLAGKRPAVSHHTHYEGEGIKVDAIRWLQRILALGLKSFSCSRMITRGWGPHVKVLPNPYEPSIFNNRGLQRDIDYLFVSRFIGEKGPFVFLAALGRLASEGKDFTFAVVGSGPLETEILAKIEEYGLQKKLLFIGTRSKDELSDLYNRTRWTVIPSLWREPFGLIAIEALACGSRLACSDQEGLREASGGFAKFFPTGNDAQLAGILRSEIASEEESEQLVAAHLAKYRAEHSTDFLLREIGLESSLVTPKRI